VDVDTRLVFNRRVVQYENLGEFLAEAEEFAATNVETLGNWSLAQIFDHLSKSLQVAVEGTHAFFPLPARLFLRPIRDRFFSRPLKPGFRVPSNLEAVLRPRQGLSNELALYELREAIPRFESAPLMAPHPAFGRLTRGEWQQITLRHAELHMSFVVPQTFSQRLPGATAWPARASERVLQPALQADDAIRPAFPKRQTD
jgi:uncharacterized protein DUF1569